MRKIATPPLLPALVCLLALCAGLVGRTANRDAWIARASGARQAQEEQQASGVSVLIQVGGPSYAIAVQDGYAYVGLGRRLAVLDVSDPRGPTLVSQTGPLPAPVLRVAVHAGHAYVDAGPPGLRVFDVGRPRAPVEVGMISTPAGAGGIAFAGSHAYLAAAAGGLRVLDVSNPAAPVEVGALEGGLAASVAVDGHYAYVGYGAPASGGQAVMLRVLDVSNPASPAPVGEIGVPGAANAPPGLPRPTGLVWGMALQGTHLYVAWESGQSGRSAARGSLRVLDVSDPANPREIAVRPTDTLHAPSAVAAEGARVYLGVGGDVVALDVTDPSAPATIGRYRTAGDRLGITVSGGRGYVAAGLAGGLRVLDLSPAGDPVEVGAYAALGEANDVAAASGRVYVGGRAGLHAFDTRDPARPVPAGSAVADASVHAVAASGTYVYAGGWSAATQSFLRVLTALPAAPSGAGVSSRPARLTELGSATLPGTPVDVTVAGRYAYVAASQEGLRILDVADPARPVEVGSHTAGYAAGVAVAGRYAYVADMANRGGMHVIDVADPAAPAEIGFFPTPSGAHGVAVDATGRYAFLADLSRGGGLLVLDIANPAAPAAVGFYRNPRDGVVYGVAAGHGTRSGQAFLAGGLSGMRVVDVTAPSGPVEAGYFDSPSVARSVAIEGDVAYLADNGGGVWVIQLTGPARNGA